MKKYQANFIVIIVSLLFLVPIPTFGNPTQAVVIIQNNNGTTSMNSRRLVEQNTDPYSSSYPYSSSSGKKRETNNEVLNFGPPVLKYDSNRSEEKRRALKKQKKPTIIAFMPGSTVLEKDMQIIIDLYVANLTLTANSRILIEGHTDSSGDHDINIKLSRLRSQAVADYLELKHNLDPNRLVVVGYGSEKPRTTNTTAKGKEKNRRVEILPLY